MMKKVLVIGGYGALGKSVIKSFKYLTPVWQTINIDFKFNEEADFNFIIQNQLNKEELENLSKSEFLKNEKLDCIINVAGGWRGGSLEDEDVIENIQSMIQMNLNSSILAAYLGKKFLNDNSLFVLTGANSVKENFNPGMIGYQISKNAVHHLSDLIISTNQLPKTKVITILPDVIDTDANRQGMPNADFSSWTKPETIAELIKKWADDKEYPQESYYKV